MTILEDSRRQDKKHKEIKRKVFLEGMKFGKLKVISFDHYSKTKMQYYLCECECGNYKTVQASHLLNGDAKSCGCVRSTRVNKPFRQYGTYNKRLHNIWNGMLDRCTNKNNPAYENYGGRGIFVCQEWHDFPTFYNWAICNGYNDSLSIERINNNDGYYAENCKWANRYEQANNKRNVTKFNYNGCEYSMAQLSKMSGIPYDTLRARLLLYGYSVEEAMIDKKNRNRVSGRKNK